VEPLPRPPKARNRQTTCNEAHTLGPPGAHPAIFANALETSRLRIVTALGLPRVYMPID